MRRRSGLQVTINNTKSMGVKGTAMKLRSLTINALVDTAENAPLPSPFRHQTNETKIGHKVYT